MENDFQLILNNNEKIIQTYKPNKKKFYLASFMCTIALYIFLVCFFTLMYAVPDDEGQTMPLAAYIITLCFIVLLIVLQIIFTKMAYKKRVYCVTNQRLVIKCGVIGVDYKSLDLNYIGAVDVYVSFLDKIVKQNTGTLRFGSMSSPMVNTASQFCFSGVTAPYELYQNIKQIIDEAKNKK